MKWIGLNDRGVVVYIYHNADEDMKLPCGHTWNITSM